MRLAASQIAWAPGDEPGAQALLRDAGFSGLEIAPTRVVSVDPGASPYEDPARAAAFAAGVKRGFGLAICSMQSIWFGQSGSIFGSERAFLLDHTKRAILFAQAAGCGNLVFGCPKNRVLPEGASPDDALPFFAELGAFAAAHGTVVALEPNPPLYGTNFINTTEAALDMARRVGSPGFKVNLDVGAMVQNGEDAALLAGHVAEINHVHLSEPNLVMIERRPLHRALAALLRAEGYDGYVSIEMKAQPLDELKRAAAWAAEVFG